MDQNTSRAAAAGLVFHKVSQPSDDKMTIIEFPGCINTSEIVRTDPKTVIINKTSFLSDSSALHIAMARRERPRVCLSGTNTDLVPYRLRDGIICGASEITQTNLPEIENRELFISMLDRCKDTILDSL